MTPDRSEFWRAALDSLMAHVAILDDQGNILAVNQAWRQFATANDQPHPDACIGVNYLEVCEKATALEPEAVAITEGIRAVLEGRRKDFYASYPCHSPKKHRWFMLRVSRFEGPPPGRLVIAHENITAPKAAQIRASERAKELEIANQTLIAQALELAQAEALEADRSRILGLIAANEILETIFHEIALSVERRRPDVCCAIVIRRRDSVAVSATPRLPVEKMRFLTENSALILESSFQGPSSGLISLAKAALGERVACANPFRTLAVNKQSDSLMACLAIASLDSDVPPSPSPVFESAASITGIGIEHSSLYEKLSFQAHHDALTAVPNRILFRELIQQAVASGKRQRTPFGLVMLDLDRFKHINDIYGHRAGDVLLRQVASRLVDLAGPGDTVARLGSDEFAVLLSGCRSSEAAEAVAQLMCTALRKPFDVLDHQLLVTCSAGSSSFPNDATESTNLIQRADTAMLEGKEKGGNSWRRYTSPSETAINQDAEIERHLRKAIGTNEIQLYYQPQTNVRREIVGAETLMRWNSRTLGAVSPGRFIPIAEQSGLILELGTWALIQACLQWKRWQAAGFQPAQIAVNVSTVQLRFGDFASKVREIIGQTEMDPAYLELEVTESSMMDSIQTAITQVEEIRAIGVKVSIDDFGTGYSSFSYLQRLPVDSVKIDQSFVRDLNEASRGTISIVQAIIALAHNLGLTVVAEGVETEGQMQILTDLHCDVLQGYLLHKPLDANTIGGIFERGARNRNEANFANVSAIV